MFGTIKTKLYGKIGLMVGYLNKSLNSLAPKIIEIVRVTQQIYYRYQGGAIYFRMITLCIFCYVFYSYLLSKPTIREEIAYASSIAKHLWTRTITTLGT